MSGTMHIRPTSVYKLCDVAVDSTLAFAPSRR